jgi:exodeoxyribonuclease VIII
MMCVFQVNCSNNATNIQQVAYKCVYLTKKIKHGMDLNSVKGIDMPNSLYHSDTARVSKSGLDMINEAPAFYKLWMDLVLEGKHEDKQTPAQKLGSVYHCLILEPYKFDELYFVASTDDGRSADYRKDSQFAAEQGLTLVKPSDYQTALEMANATKGNPGVYKLMEMGLAEQVYYWTDPLTGIECRMKADWVSMLGEKVYLLDFKSAMNASPKEFGKAAYNQRYHVQAAFYLDGFELATGIKPSGFVNVVVEKDAPYLTELYTVDDMELALGREAYRGDLNTLLECRKRNHYWGYSHPDSPMFKALKLPSWAYPRY